MQISTISKDYLVDTIILHDVMGLLRPVFANPGICKVILQLLVWIIWLNFYPLPPWNELLGFYGVCISLRYTHLSCEILGTSQLLLQTTTVTKRYCIYSKKCIVMSSVCPVCNCYYKKSRTNYRCYGIDIFIDCTIMTTLLSFVEFYLL